MTTKHLESLVKEYHRPLFFWARQCCGFDDHLAEEVFQIAVLKVLEGKAVFKGKSDPKTWLYAVIRNTAYEQIRKEKKHLSLDVLEEADWVIEYHEEELGLEFQESMLLQLPARQREVLLLVFYHHHSLENASQIMDLSVGTVRTHYDRAKKKLKELLLNQKQCTNGNI
jgi:RNA polymerase sigma factor (sigma-70 family)